MTQRVVRSVWVLLMFGWPLVVGVPAAEGRLDAKSWRQVEKDAKRLFGRPGNKDAKLALLPKIMEDGEKRAWKLLVQGIQKEGLAWVDAERAVQAKEVEIAAIESKPFKKRSPAEQTSLTGWKEELLKLEAEALGQSEVVKAFTDVLAAGPAALRKDLKRSVKAGADWTVRAAAARIFAQHLDEKLSNDAFRLLLEIDKDARVRLSALKALGDAASQFPTETWSRAEEPATDPAIAIEHLTCGRLADADWRVRLRATRIIHELRMTAGVPHLIGSMHSASRRVRYAIGETLRTLTREEFDDDPDVWARWWEEHKEEYGAQDHYVFPPGEKVWPDTQFYGLRIRSDRILFILDTSGSMKLKTQNENPAEKWKPAGPVTPEDGDAPPPPPPEEILSGPKIDVAKHELKKALKKLPDTAKFNIIAFDSTIRTWREKMVDASTKNVDEALQWVRSLKPKGSTYVDGALRKAFRMAGLAAVDKACADVNIDTIVLLSDGAPNDGGAPGRQARLVDDEVILQHVREWNRDRSIVIHTIGVNMLPYIEFLKKLAAENGGEYVDR